MEQLNSSVIRIFKTHYPIGYYPVMDDIVSDEIETSEKWDVWHINEPSVYVGKLTKEYQQAEQGSVMSYIAIIERLKYGKYTHCY